MQKVLSRLEQIALALAVIAILTMMFLTAWDAIGRYLLGKPLSWAFQLTTYYLLASATYFALSATLTKGDHIGIDALRIFLPKSFLRFSDALWSLAAAVVLGIITWGSIDALKHAWKTQEFLPGDIMWPVWLAILPIILGCAVMMLRLLSNAWGLIVHNTPLPSHSEEDHP